MNPETFDASIALLSKLYGHALERQVTDTYWHLLKHLSDRQFQLAVQNTIRTFRPTTQCPFPVPADLLNACGSGDEMHAHNVVTMVREAIVRVGAWDSVDFGDRALHQVIERFGGWTVICTWTHQDWQYNRRAFVEAYRAASAAEIKGPAALEGWINKSNRASGWFDYLKPPKRVTMQSNGQIRVQDTPKLEGLKCPECGANWDEEHNRCVARCDALLADKQLPKESP